MKAQIQDIKRALSAKAYLSAFALALTIPDACGLEMELLAGKSYSKVKNQSGKRYIAWYKNIFRIWITVFCLRRSVISCDVLICTKISGN